MLVADSYPNFSICGIPYYLSGEVTDWRDLAHSTIDQIEDTGVQLRLNERATSLDAQGKMVPTEADGQHGSLPFDRVVIATGAEPALPPIAGLTALGSGDGVHVLHTMDDTFALHEKLQQLDGSRAAIIGAGYIGLEMAEALTALGQRVTVFEAFDQVLPRTPRHRACPARPSRARAPRSRGEVRCHRRGNRPQ